MIDVVCTGKGTHPRVFVATIDPESPTEPRRGRRRLRKGQATTWTAPIVSDGARTFECPKCSRAPQLTPERLRVLVAGLTAEGVEVFDLSSLPF